MKKVINPQYLSMESELIEVLKGNYTPDLVFCKKRNVVEKVTVAGEEFVVKRYKRPLLINRIVYTFFRKSKACRAYEFAMKLLEAGIDTPFPGAYAESGDGGLFCTGVFISKYVPYKLLEDVYDDSISCEERSKILNDFIDFLMSVHAKGIIPKDMNGSNIFYYKNEASGQYNFALTDINRMVFNAKPTPKDMAFSFEQCFSELEKLIDLSSIYSAKIGTIPMGVLYQVLSFRFKRIKQVKFRNKFKKK